MARWEAALAEKERIAKWWLTDRGQDYGRRFHADVVRKGRVGRAAYVDIAEREAKKLKGGDPVWISDEVMDLVEAAADHPSFRFEAIRAEDLFCEQGFALLPRSRFQTDVNGLTVSFQAFSWGPDWRRWAEPDGTLGREPALSVTLYTDWHDDIYDADGTAHNAPEAVADRVPGMADGARWRQAFGSDLSMFHSAFIPWGELPWEILDEQAESYGYEGTGVDDGVRTSVLGLWSFIQAFFRLANQRIVLRDRTLGDRKSRRRLQRMAPETPGVLVVRLRRTRSANGGEGESEVEWSRRWIVGGHWRNQHYPTLGPPEDPDAHRQIWISPYVKGPDEKPLVLHSERVYEFVR